MSLPSHIWAVPDLSLLIPPKNLDPRNSDFFKDRYSIFLRHDNQVKALENRILELCSRYEEYKKCKIAWGLSTELKVQLLNEFPWNAIGGIPWVRDMMMTFPSWVDNTSELSTIIHSPSPQIKPDIVPKHVQKETKLAWLEMLIICVQETTDWSRITSHSGQKHDTVQLQVFSDKGKPKEQKYEYEITLLHNPTEWDTIHRRLDPWFAEDLPYNGKESYRPPKKWNPGEPFPKDQTGRGFLDEYEQTWVWDPNEEHWDVQEMHKSHKKTSKRQKQGNYHRVSTDGRRL
jgi:hypothetical protein